MNILTVECVRHLDSTSQKRCSNSLRYHKSYRKSLCMKQWIFFFDSIALSFSMLFKNKSLYYVNFFVKNYSDTF